MLTSLGELKWTWQWFVRWTSANHKIGYQSQPQSAYTRQLLRVAAHRCLSSGMEMSKSLWMYTYISWSWSDSGCAGVLYFDFDSCSIQVDSWWLQYILCNWEWMPWHVHISKQCAHVRGVYHPKPSSLESEYMIVVGFLIAFLLIEMPSLGLSRNSIHIFKSSPIGCVVNLMPFLLLLAMVSNETVRYYSVCWREKTALSPVLISMHCLSRGT